MDLKSQNEWTWIKDSTLLNVAGTYGTKGVANPTNSPVELVPLGGQSTKINFSEESVGMYLVKITQSGNVLFESKIIKE